MSRVTEAQFMFSLTAQKQIIRFLGDKNSCDKSGLKSALPDARLSPLKWNHNKAESVHSQQ